YTAGTIINAGTLSVNADTKLGNVSSVFGGTPTSPISPIVNNVIIDGGTLQATASFALQSNRGVGIGPMTGGAGGTGAIDTSGAATTLSYGGIMASSGNSGVNNLVKIGAGTLVLSGANTYNGSTTVSAGTMNVTGSIANNASNKVFVAVDPDNSFGTSDDI